MAVVAVSASPHPHLSLSISVPISSSSRAGRPHLPVPFCYHYQRLVAEVSQLCETPVSVAAIDNSALNIAEALSEDELWAAVWLRIRAFHVFGKSFGIEHLKRNLAKRDFQALKEGIAGKRKGFARVSCINATLPLSHIMSLSHDLCTQCKFSENGEDRVVIGTLDLKCSRLPDGITGLKAKGIAAGSARAYLSNVCVAKELRRNGLGYELIAKAKKVAEDWGITHFHVLVAASNEPAKKLYVKSGFVYESDEPAVGVWFPDQP
ncbi:hypothetical protein NMG60_11005790 [Bertholletia excelsa]